MRKYTNQLVWDALKQKNHQTVREIAIAIGRAESTTYAFLNRAVQLGTITRHLSEPNHNKGGPKHIYSLVKKQ